MPSKQNSPCRRKKTEEKVEDKGAISNLYSNDTCQISPTQTGVYHKVFGFKLGESTIGTSLNYAYFNHEHMTKI